VLLACAVLAAAGCSEDANPLAPYEGGRPLDLLEVTQSFTPEIQWVGGRVAAVGVNRGTRAALDSTLVWVRTAPGNDISSFVTVGEGMDEALVMGFGGTTQDSLTDGETYTFWLAERSAFDAGLDSTRFDPAAFADTTFTVRLILEGTNRNSDDLDVTFEIERNERLTGERFIVRWTPADVVFRRMAIRDAPTGGFTELIWHILSPEDGPPLITSPVTLSAPPEGVVVVEPFEGFAVDSTASTYLLWAVTDGWNEEFNPPDATGYAQFQIRSCNFDIDDPCD
jgi:hypothetical protein